MKLTIIFIISNFIIGTTFGQELIPKEYKAIKEIYGDLNKDSTDERVVVYNTTDIEDEVSGTDREIIIFKKNNENWIIWHRSKNAIGNSKDGGMMGDPFEDVEIKNGILLISQSGGSSWKWRNTDKYRFQNNNFELIGHSSVYGKICEYWADFDFNISTGKIIFKKEYENCDNENQVVYKNENENFSYKLDKTVTLENRTEIEIKIISPKYSHEIYL